MNDDTSGIQVRVTISHQVWGALALSALLFGAAAVVLILVTTFDKEGRTLNSFVTKPPEEIVIRRTVSDAPKPEEKKPETATLQVWLRHGAAKELKDENRDLCFFLTGFTQGEETMAAIESLGELTLKLTSGATGSKPENCARLEKMPMSGDATPLTLSLTWDPGKEKELRLGSYQGQIIAKAAGQGESTDDIKQFFVQAVRIVVEGAPPSTPTPASSASQLDTVKSLIELVTEIRGAFSKLTPPT